MNWLQSGHFNLNCDHDCPNSVMPHSGSGVCVSGWLGYGWRMTRLILPVFTGLLFISSCVTQVAETPKMPESLSIPTGYALVWADEFEQDGLPNEQNWAYDTEYNQAGWWNGELQYYSAARTKNSRVENGRLIIEAHEEPVLAEQFPDTGDQAYTSTRLFTKDKAAWQYGYFEVRAKLPCGHGLWPAIWTLPEGQMRWPNDGEIDIMEYVGWREDRFHATVHTRDNNHKLGTHFGASYTAATACGGFHTHSLLWTDEEILVAVDGMPYFHYPKGDKGYGEWPFDHPHYLILNLAIGGWGGREGIDPDAFPAQMEVDYVRIYQKRHGS